MVLPRDRLGAGLVSFLKRCIFACPGDEGHPPVAPLPPPPPPPPHHLGFPLAHLPIHAEIAEEGGGETGVALGAALGRDGVPDLTPEAEEEMVEVDRGGDTIGRVRGPMTVRESERGTETGDDTLHAGEQGENPSP